MTDNRYSENFKSSSYKITSQTEKGEWSPSVTLLHTSRKTVTMDVYEVEDLCRDLRGLEFAIEEPERGHAITIDLNACQLKIVLMDKTKCELPYKQK